MPAVQNLDVISINIWSILISLANLLILFLLVKKFLYKPVRKMVAARQAHIEAQYLAAEEAKSLAEKSRDEYSKKLEGAQEECASLLQTAEADSQRLSDGIIAEAKGRAASILRSADSEIELERKKAMQRLKQDIAGLSVELTENLLEREMNAADHARLIDSFIDGIGSPDAGGQSGTGGENDADGR